MAPSTGAAPGAVGPGAGGNGSPAAGRGGAPPPPPPSGPTAEERRQRRWSLTERVLAVLAAALSVVAGVLALWGTRASSERDDLQATTDSLVDERDDLSGQLAEAHDRIEVLETPTTTSTSEADEPGDTPPGEATYLNELEPVSGAADTRETELGGQRYRNVVRQELKVCGVPDTVEYNLGQEYSRFTALAGLHDTVDDPTDIWRFVVTTIDARGEHVVFQQEVPFAQPAAVDVSVEGAQRLRLSIEEVEIGWVGSNCLIDDAPATWADPELTR
jgi:hypothetical protein